MERGRLRPRGNDTVKRDKQQERERQGDGGGGRVKGTKRAESLIGPSSHQAEGKKEHEDTKKNIEKLQHTP